ncbi:MAG: YihY/virulence factor BrkB family protein [Desulfobacteraceae bacterium]|nr:YihY/virulence factor BrkB family protein [Desulfobacteraceae bacterium]
MGWPKAFLFVKHLWIRSSSNAATDLAAQLAFYFMLSIFPFLIFAVTLFGYTSITVGDVIGLVRQFAPEVAQSALEKNLHDVLDNRQGGLLSFGIIGTIWAASNALSAVIGALNRAYRVEETRSFFEVRAMALLLTLAMVLTIVVSLLLPVLGNVIRATVGLFILIPDRYAMIWSIVRWLLSSCVMLSVFICIYYLAPNLKLQFREVIAGAVFSTAGWQVASMGFSYYLSNFANYSATYGSVGTVIALMMWFYLIALILILGGEVNALLKTGKVQPERTASAPTGRPNRT